MTDAFGASRVQVRPPERGVFPLDHDSECKPRMQDYLQCLKANANDHFPCKSFSKAYLACRMEVDLMAKEDLSKLGLEEGSAYIRTVAPEGVKERSGFVAGIGVKASNKGTIFGGSASSHR